MTQNAVFNYLDANSRVDFPLVGRAATPAGLYELLVDAYVIHNSGIQQNVQITNLDPAGDLELRFADATLLATLTAADDFQSRTWGEWTLLQWQRQTVTVDDLTDEEIVAKLVLRTSKLADFVFPMAPVGATLQPSLVVNRIDRVRRFLLARPNTVLPMPPGYHDPAAPDVIDAEVRLDAGYNMRIDVATEDIPGGLQLPAVPETRPKTRLTFHAIPGAGLGLYNPCGVPEGIKTINGVGPDAAGNFAIEALDCYWVERPLSGAKAPPVKPGTDYRAAVVPNTLQIHNNCKACCSCGDYGNAYRELVAAWDRAKRVAARIEHSRERYNTLRDFLAAAKTEREVGLRVFLQAVPRPDFSVSLDMIVMNNAAADVTTDIEIRTYITFEPDILQSEYLERSGRLDAEEQRAVQVDPTKNGEEYYITVPYLRAAHYARYSFDLRCTRRIPSATLRQDVTVRAATRALYGTDSAWSLSYARLAKPVEKT